MKDEKIKDIWQRRRAVFQNVLLLPSYTAGPHLSVSFAVSVAVCPYSVKCVQKVNCATSWSGR